MPLSKEQKIEYLATVAGAIYETIRDNQSPFGTPGGHIYATLMGLGWSLQMYETLMATLVETGKVVKRGECYFPKDITS